MSLLRRAASALAAVAALATTLALAGCGAADYDHTDIGNVKASPLGGGINVARVQVPAGMVVTAHIVSYDDDHKTMSMTFKSKDTNVVDVSNVVSGDDYAFFGLRPGVTEVEMTAAGKVVLIVTAVVTDQPPLP